MATRTKVFLFCSLFCFLIPSPAQQPSRDAGQIHGAMEFLASDALQGRGSGTHDELVAATYLASQLRQIGIEPAGDNGGYIQNVYIRNCVTRTADYGIHMTMRYFSSSPANSGVFIPLLRNIDIRDCAFAGLSTAGIFLQGINGSNQITDINIVNCRFGNPTNSFSNTNRINLVNNRDGGT